MYIYIYTYISVYFDATCDLQCWDFLERFRQVKLAPHPWHACSSEPFDLSSFQNLVELVGRMMMQSRNISRIIKVG